MGLYEQQHVRQRRQACAVIHILPWEVSGDLTSGQAEALLDMKNWMEAAVQRTSEVEKERLLVLTTKVIPATRTSVTDVWGTLRVSCAHKTITCGWHGDLGISEMHQGRIEQALSPWAITDGRRVEDPDLVSWKWQFSSSMVEQRPLVAGESILAAMWWAWRFWKEKLVPMSKMPDLRLVREWSALANAPGGLEVLFSGPRYSRKGATEFEPEAWQAGVVGKREQFKSNGGGKMLETDCRQRWQQAKWLGHGTPGEVAQGSLRLLSWNVDGWGPESECLWTLLRCGEVGVWAGQDLRWDAKRSMEQKWKAMNHWGSGSLRWTVEEGQLTGSQSGAVERRMGGAALLSSAQWAARHHQSITDDRGWGRYAGQALQGKNGQQLVLVSVYAPCKSGAVGGGGMWATQQRAMDGLKLNVDPWSQLVEDLIRVLHPFRLAGAVLVIAGDFNYDPVRRPGARAKADGGRGQIWEGLLDTLALDDVGAGYEWMATMRSAERGGGEWTQPSALDRVLVTQGWGSRVTLSVGALGEEVNSMHNALVVDIPAAAMLGVETYDVLEVDAAAPFRSSLRRSDLREVDRYRDMVTAKWGVGNAEAVREAIEAAAALRAGPSDDVEHVVNWQMEHEARALEAMDKADRLVIHSLVSLEKARMGYKPPVGGSRVRPDGWSPELVRRRKVIRKIRLLARAAKRNRGYAYIMSQRVAVNRLLDGTSLPSDDRVPTVWGESFEARRVWANQLVDMADRMASNQHRALKRMDRSKMKLGKQKKEWRRRRGKVKAYIRSVLQPLADDVVGRRVGMEVDRTDSAGQAYSEVLTDPRAIAREVTQHFEQWMGKGRQRWFIPRSTQEYQHRCKLWDDSEEGRATRLMVAETGARPMGMPRVFLPLMKHFRPKHDPNTGEEAKAEWYGELMGPITEEEWLTYWQGKKGGKAPGITGVTAEMIALLPEEQSTQLRHLYSQALLTGIPFSSWGRTILCPTPKVVGSTRLDDMRPLQLLEVMRKAICGILRFRIMKTLTAHNLLSEAQHGFRSHHSAVEPALMLVSMAEEARRKGKELHVLSLDIRRAYDSLERFTGKEMALRRVGIPENTITFFEKLDAINRTTVKSVAGLAGESWHEEGVGTREDGEWFTAETGWCQGAEEAPLGWTLFYDILLTFLEKSSPEKRGVEIQGPDLQTKCVDTEAYADDTISYSTSTEGIQSTLDLINVFLTFMGLSVAAAKCKYACTKGRGGNSPSRPTLLLKDILRVGGRPQHIHCIPVSEAFRYLGIWVAMDGKWSVQCAKLVQQVTGVTQAMRGRAVDAGGADVLLNTVLRARIIYPAKFMTLSQSQFRSLEWPARKVWLHRHSLSQSTSKRRAGMHKRDGGLGWQSWYQATMVEKTLSFMVAINGNDKLAHLLQGQVQRWGAGASRQVGDRWVISPPSSGDDDLKQYKEWSKSWVGSILVWLGKVGASLRRRDTVHEAEGLTPPRYGSPLTAEDQGREVALTFSDGTGSYQDGQFRTAYACVEIDSEEGGTYEWPVWGNPVGGGEGDQTVARSEALGLLEGLRAGPAAKYGITQKHFLDRLGSVSTFQRLPFLSTREWLNLRNRDVWLSAALWAKRVPQASVHWQRGHPERIKALEQAAWSDEQVGIHRADSEADKVMEKWKERQFQAHPRPVLERGSQLRWELWIGDAEAVMSLRETLWSLARAQQTQEIHSGVRRTSTYAAVPTPAEGGVDSKLLHRSFRSATKRLKQVQEEEWNGDFCTEDLTDDWGALGWETTYVNAKRFKFLWGLLPDQTIRGDRGAWGSEIGGKGSPCLVCGAMLTHDSNEHSLLWCGGRRSTVARRLWSERIHNSVRAAEFPHNLRDSLLARWTVSRQGMVVTAPCPGQWGPVLSATEVSCVWRGLLPARWTECWWEPELRSARLSLTPGELRDKLACVVRGVWRGWNGVWKAYCEDFQDALAQQHPELLRLEAPAGITSRELRALQLVEEGLFWMAVLGLREFIEPGRVSIKSQSTANQFRWVLADKVRLIPSRGPFEAPQRANVRQQGTVLRNWTDIRDKATQVLGARTRQATLERNRRRRGESVVPLYSQAVRRERRARVSANSGCQSFLDRWLEGGGSPLRPGQQNLVE